VFQNVGKIDKVIRVVLAVALGVFGVLNISTGLWWVGLIGLLPLGTALVGTCPVYLPFGITTIKTEKLKK